MENKAYTYQYLMKKKNFQEFLLDYLTKETNQKDFQKLINFFDEQKIKEDKGEFQSFILLLNSISENHQQCSSLIEKVGNLIQFFQVDIQKYYTIKELYDIFKNNKKICSYLLSRFPIEIDHQAFVYSNMSDDDPKTLAINQMIQNDSLDDFITFVNQNEIELSYECIDVCLETNQFLFENHPTYIEYAAFCGSIQIFKYLLLNKCQINPLIWLYSVHGNNFEIIHIIEEKQVKPPNNSYLECFYESLKYHHIELADYFYQNHISDSEENKIDIIRECIKYHNFISILDFYGDHFNDVNFMNQIGFLYICLEFDYTHILPNLLLDGIDINNISTYKNEDKEIIKDMKQAAIHTAIEKENIEAIKLFLSQPKINVNLKSVTRIKNHPDNIHFFNDYYEDDFYGGMNYENHYEYFDGDEYIIEYSTLYMALQKGNKEIVDLLLSRNDIDVNSLTIIQRKKSNDDVIIRDEKTALSMAIKKGYSDIVSFLLSKPEIDLNKLSTSYCKDRLIVKKTPLSLACEVNNFEIVQILLLKGDININQQIEYSYNILKIHNYDPNAIFLEDEEYFEKFSSSIMQTVFNIAVKKNNLDIVKLLLSQKDIDINIVKKLAVEDAIYNSNAEILKLLLSHPIISSNLSFLIEEGNYLLNEAVRSGNIEIVNSLLEIKEIDINKLSDKCRKTPLHIAIVNQYEEIVKLLLLRPGIDVNLKLEGLDIDKEMPMKLDQDFPTKKYNKTPLCLAIEKSNIEIIKLLLQHKTLDINLKSSYNRSETIYREYEINDEGDFDCFPYEEEEHIIEKAPLHVAIENDNAEIVKLLLENPNIDVNIKLDSQKVTKILPHGHSTIEKSSKTVLDIAINGQNKEIVSLLLERNDIDVNCRSSSTIDEKNYTNNSNLIIAVKTENAEIVKILLNNKKIEKKLGFSIQYYTKNKEIIRLFKKKHIF